MSQAVGLETTTATRGAFLIQTTALFTPLIAGLAGSEVSATVWLATLLGAGGTALFTASSHPVADAVQQMAPQFGGVCWRCRKGIPILRDLKEAGPCMLL